VRNPVVRTNKCERYNNENRHTPNLQASTEQKRVKAHVMHFVEFPWCCATLRAYVECMNSLDCLIQANVRKVDHLCFTSVLDV